MPKTKKAPSYFCERDWARGFEWDIFTRLPAGERKHVGTFFSPVIAKRVIKLLNKK